MRIHTSFFFLLSALLCGCSSDGFKSGSGDVGQFILQQAISRGGSPTTNALPPLAGSWRYSEDTNGVVIHMSRDQYPAVEAFLRQSFGTPKIEPTQTSDGGMLGVYRLSEKGGGIQFGYDAKQTQIIVIRPMSTKEISRGVVEATKEMEKSK
jgi:hypothetical protein